MKKKLNGIYLLVLLICASIVLALSSCSDNRLTGGGSETTNTITGRIAHEDGSPATRTEVSLVPLSYDPTSLKSSTNIHIDTTDGVGKYEFNNIPTGSYNIAAIQLDTRTSVFSSGIDVVDKKNTSITQVVLKNPTTLLVYLPESLFNIKGTIYLPGTSFSSPIIAAKSFVSMDSTPPGIYPEIRCRKEDGSSFVVYKNIVVDPNESTVVSPYQDWKYSAKIHLNTTALGMNIISNEINVPVPIRLNHNNFDFTQALSSGSDIRFTSSNGIPLPYEIESWDKGQETAMLWVKVQVLYGNSDQQYLHMYWGSPNAKNTSSGFNVFFAEEQWSHVWHLSESANDTIKNGVYHDASGNGNAGNDKVLSTNKTGVLGLGQQFDFGDYIVLPNPTEPFISHMVTVSVWAKTNALGDSGSNLVSMGDSYVIRINKKGFAEFVVSDSLGNTHVTAADSSVNLLDSAWHNLGGIYDGIKIWLYVDGEIKGQTFFKNLLPSPATKVFVVGKNAMGKPGYEFSGWIDEMQVTRKARSAIWMKLSYALQRPDNKGIYITP